MKPEELGAQGEAIAIRELISKGYSLVRFGVPSGSRAPSNARCEKDLPQMPDFIVGTSFGDFHRFVAGLPLVAANDWIPSQLPTWADISLAEIGTLTRECRSRRCCPYRDSNPNTAPCTLPDQILSKDWLTSLVINHPAGADNGIRPIRGHNVVQFCLNRFSHMLLAKHRHDIRAAPNFIVANMLISDYIRRAVWRESERPMSEVKNLPHCGSEILEAMRRGDKNEAERLKTVNREFLRQSKSFKRDLGSPGRFDFLGEKDGILYAMEVKVNSSTLTYWQSVRLGLLQRLGYETVLVRVTIPKKAAQADLFENAEPRVNLVHNPEIEDATLPAFDDVNAVLKFKASHERAREATSREDSPFHYEFSPP